VLTADDEVLGYVTDLQCTLDGPSRGAVPAPRLRGLVVTPRLTGSSLGYQQRGHRGPWLIGALVRWLHRNSRVVDWDLVDEVRSGEIRLKADADT